MLDKDEFLYWSHKLHLSEQAQQVIDHIRSSDPARRVQSGSRNVSGAYPSRKMGVTIQFESHRVELATVYEMEHDADVIEYYDQPPSFKLEYDSANGRRMGVLHTPDYFAIRKETAGWEECKTEEQLDKLSEKNPNRYCRDESGEWRCPPGEAYADQFNLYYRVRTSKTINWIFQRNVQFLEDYLRADTPIVDPKIAQQLLKAVIEDPSVTLDVLFDKSNEYASRDNIYTLIAAGHLFVDLKANPLIEPAQVRVFPNKETAEAYARIVEVPSPGRSDAPRFVDIEIGSVLQWNERPWKIANIGRDTISLIGESNALTELPLLALESLVKEGRVTGVSTDCGSTVSEEAASILREAGQNDLQAANRRAQLVSCRLRGERLPPDNNVSDRTLRRWTARYKLMKAKYGNGYLGLLPLMHNRGFRGSKLPQATLKLIADFIENDYETHKQKRKYEVWIVLKNRCEQEGVIVPSYKTFARAIKDQRGYLQTFKRKGRRAAYAQEPFYWELDQKTPRHGDRPFEICHIDHTELDIECRCQRTGQNLGRPWFTLLTDAYSRRILAIYLTFDPPSYRSCMMVLRQCVRLHGRLPQIVVVDGGKEFRSIYFDTLLARYECMKKTRPPAKARFGSVCERLFGTTNTQFIYNLEGNTQITRNVRQVTKSVNPKFKATWPLGSLYDRLCQYAYRVYDEIQHTTLGMSPRDAFVEGMARTGSRSHRLIPYDQDFLMWTLPTTPKGSAKVQPGRGFKIHHLYYWSDALRDPNVEGSQVDVRYDPFDISTAFAFIAGRWVTCHSEHYAAFRGRSEKEIMLATKELRGLKTKHSRQFGASAKQLANFLESVEGEEMTLMQRLHDSEGRHVLNAINGEVAAPVPNEVASSPVTEPETLGEIPTATDSQSLEVYEDF